MNEKLLIEKLEEKIRYYEARREKTEIGTYMWEMLGIRIMEVREAICDVCDWAIDEHIKEMEKKFEEFMKEEK